jgi:hypothetical protein
MKARNAHQVFQRIDAVREEKLEFLSGNKSIFFLKHWKSQTFYPISSISYDKNWLKPILKFFLYIDYLVFGHPILHHHFLSFPFNISWNQDTF